MKCPRMNCQNAYLISWQIFKKWESELLVNFFDPISLSESELLQQNQLYHFRIQSISSELIERDQKYFESDQI